MSLDPKRLQALLRKPSSAISTLSSQLTMSSPTSSTRMRRFVPPLRVCELRVLTAHRLASLLMQRAFLTVGWLSTLVQRVASYSTRLL